MEVGSDIFFCIVVYPCVKITENMLCEMWELHSEPKVMNVSLWHTTPEKSVVLPEDQVSFTIMRSKKT